MRDTLFVRLAAVLCRAENDGAQARASCLPAVGGAALQLTKRPGRKPSGAASGGFCKSLQSSFSAQPGGWLNVISTKCGKFYRTNKLNTFFEFKSNRYSAIFLFCENPNP